MDKKVFNKPVLTIHEQLDLLKSRGLIVKDSSQAEYYLKHIGYYRLSGYCLSFQNNTTSSFAPQTTFSQVLDLYVFDRKLRLLFLDAIERIEIALRAVMINTLSMKEGAHWYLKRELFREQFKHDQFLEILKKEMKLNHHQTGSREPYIEAYCKKYISPELPASWMVFETISFGTVSSSLKNLQPKFIKLIAKEFNLPYKILASWIESISYVRNLCAHHSRIWNRVFTKKPKIMVIYEGHLSANDKIYAQLFITNYFMKLVSGDTHWAFRLIDLYKSLDIPLQPPFVKKFKDEFWR